MFAICSFSGFGTGLFPTSVAGFEMAAWFDFSSRIL
jgi:hypothetical protein